MDMSDMDFFGVFAFAEVFYHSHPQPLPLFAVLLWWCFLVNKIRYPSNHPSSGLQDGKRLG